MAREARYHMRVSPPGMCGLHFSIDNAPLNLVIEWLFAQLRPGVLLHAPEAFKIFAFERVLVDVPEEEPDG